jgi:hypothetical protein
LSVSADKADWLAARYHHGCIWLTQQRGGTVNCRSGDYAAAMVAGERQFHGSSAFRSRLLVRPETIRCRTTRMPGGGDLTYASIENVAILGPVTEGITTLARLIVVPLYLISWIAFASEAPITIKVLESDPEIATDATTVQNGPYEFWARNPVAAQRIA